MDLKVYEDPHLVALADTPDSPDERNIWRWSLNGLTSQGFSSKLDAELDFLHYLDAGHDAWVRYHADRIEHDRKKPQVG